MPGTTLTVALAGGAGAVIGSVLGQAVQWFRDRWMLDKSDDRRKAEIIVEDRRRREDAQRDAAREARQVRRDDYKTHPRNRVRFAVDLPGARQVQSEVLNDPDPGSLDRAITAAADAVKGAFDALSEWRDTQHPTMLALAESSGSDSVLRLAGEVDSLMLVVNLLRARLLLPDFATADDPKQGGVLRLVETVAGEAGDVTAQVEALVAQIRQELDPMGSLVAEVDAK